VRTRTIVIVVVIVVVIGSVATAAIALSSSGSHSYRTAVATTGAVTQQLNSTGTIEPLSQATVAFPISGTVASVNATLGASVTTGQTLATLDTTSLTSAVLSKQATLASAELDLYKAVNGEAISGGSRTGSGGTGSASSGATTPTTDAVTTAAVTTNTDQAAQEVVAAQHAVDIAMASVNSALAAANTACGEGSSSGTPHGPTTTTTSTTPSSPPTTGIGSAACQSAQQTLFSAQQDLAQKQQALGQAENAYGQALRSSSGGDGSSTGGGSFNGGTGKGSTGSSESSHSTGSTHSSGSTGSTSVTYSAQQLVAYQAAVDAAAAGVAAAQESVAQATITSPINGTVVALSLQTGEQVSAGSSTANVMVAGADGYEIATSVGVNNITQVKVGDAASVIPDGSLQSLDGKIVFIGSPSSSSTTTTYPVVIGLTGNTASLQNGAMATTTINTATSKQTAVLVPTSAVHNLTGARTVTVLQNGKTSTVAVQVGVVGAQQTEITSGLKAGQTVVIADINQAVPSSNADSRIASQFGSGLTGGSSGGTGGGGGFRGG
jgi:HlyD family secretion protein